MKRITFAALFSALPLATGAAQINDTPFSPPPGSTEFITQSHIRLSLKNYWKYLKEENQNPKRVHNAWGQGVAMNYQSGYFHDIIGVDADFYGAAKLGASDYFHSRGVLYSRGSGNKKSNAQGYAKFGQRNLKLKTSLGEAQGQARWGWQKISNLGVLTSSTRLSPTTYLGWSGTLRYGALSLRAAWIDRAMERNTPDTMRLQTNSGGYLNHIASGDVLWQRDRLALQYGVGESSDYLRRQLLLANYALSERWRLGAQLYTSEALDAYKAMPVGKRDFDRRASHYALDLEWKSARWRSKGGIGYTRAPKKGEVGFYPRHMSKGSRGTFTSMAYAGDDYLRDGEWVLSNLTEYQIDPTVTLGLTGNIARFSYRGQQVRSGEINAFARWTPRKDLSLWAMAGPGWSYKSQGKTPLLTGNHSARTHTLASEVIIEYRFDLL